MKGISLKKRVAFKKSENITLIEADSEESVPDTRENCQFCGRLFWPGLHAKHQKLCPKVFMSRRPVFGLRNLEFIHGGALRKLNENWRIQ